MRPVPKQCVLISTQYVLHEAAIHYAKLNNPRHTQKQDVNHVYKSPGKTNKQKPTLQ